MTKILVVDDERSIRAMLELMLQRFGYEVLLASNGEDGLKILEKKDSEVSLVISDIRLPGIQGNEMIKALNGKAPPAIFVSGLEKTLLKVAREFPEATCLVKPFKVNTMKTAIEQVFS